jgi:hypothetical protein
MIPNVVFFGDTHCGCRFGLCPPNGVQLDGGGFYHPSNLQKKMWGMWLKAWDWVYDATRGEPFVVVFCGDAVDGKGVRGATHQFTHNLTDQVNVAYDIMAPIVEAANGHFYFVRGTEAHGGPSCESEEALARRLGAIPNRDKECARYELWLEIGRGKKKALINVMHHIGTTSRTAYETSAVMAEMSEAFTESGRWHERVPDIIVRAHRHRNIAIRIPTVNGYGIAFTTPAWQLKTPFAYRVQSRMSAPQIGLSLVRVGDEDIFDRHRVFPMERESPVVCREK